MLNAARQNWIINSGFVSELYVIYIFFLMYLILPLL